MYLKTVARVPFESLPFTHAIKTYWGLRPAAVGGAGGAGTRLPGVRPRLLTGKRASFNHGATHYTLKNNSGFNTRPILVRFS
jgi:hypothetical protein